ncbi:MAG: T9SS type A sorting domain-containing protein [Bacteroidales bacterium]|nr:T9SS type A sorting domain-containing protein [Bacteroidales bacterium]
MKNIYKFFFSMATILLLSVFNGLFSQTTITQWTFEVDVITPATGSGTAALIGGTSSTFATGNGGGRGWNTSTYPAQGTNSGTGGVQYTVSTSNYKDIIVSWDQRHSNTGANRVRLKYTLNGSTWVDFVATATNAINTKAGVDVGFDNGRYIADAGDTWFVRNANLSAFAGANNNPAFAIRLVSEFVDGTNYAASTPASAYATLGTWRWDNVTFAGTPIVGIDEIAKASMLLGPNPTKGLVNITLPESGMIIRVYNALGQMVYETKPLKKELLLHLANYGKGVFIVESLYEDEKPFARSKVLVQ